MADATEQESEMERRESEAKFGTLVESLGEGINIVNGHQRFIFANPAAEQIFGVEPGGLVGRHLSEFTLSDASTIIQHQANERRQGRTTTYHLPIVRPDGQKRQLWVTGSPSFSANGEFTSAFAVFRDITERMSMELALRESLQLLSRAEHVARMGFFDWNIKTNEIKVSTGANQLIQLSPDEPLVSPDIFKRVVHPDDFEVVQKAIDLAVQDIKPFEIDFRLLCGEGHVVWVRALSEFTRDSSGTPSRLLVTLVDISDRVRVEHQLEDAFNQLERRVEERTRDLRIANDALARESENRKHMEEQARKHCEELAHVSRLNMMGEMATGIAHELNQPLCAIANFAFAGQQRLRQEDSPHAEYLCNIFEALSKQAVRAGDIVRWLRGSAKKTSSQFTTTELNRIVEEVASLMESELRLNQIRFETNLVDTAVWVSIDSIQIQQVVVNLIRNAIDAMASTDRDRRELTVTTSNSGRQMAEVAVSDTGTGIPADKLEDVFNTFYTTKETGLGLGLAISRTIIEEHGGRLWVQQNSNRGVTFRFAIPVESDDESSGQ